MENDHARWLANSFIQVSGRNGGDSPQVEGNRHHCGSSRISQLLGDGSLLPDQESIRRGIQRPDARILYHAWLSRGTDRESLSRRDGDGRDLSRSEERRVGKECRALEL